MPQGSVAGAYFEHQYVDAHPTVRLRGNWRVENLGDIERHFDQMTDLPQAGRVTLDLTDLDDLDLSGALLVRNLGARLALSGGQVSWTGLSPETSRLLERSGGHDGTGGAKNANVVVGWVNYLAHVLRSTLAEIVQLVSLLGEVLICLISWVFNPSRIRWTAITHHCFQIGVGVLPVVILTSLLIGAIVTQQAAFQLRTFGAEILAVNLVAILVLRELALIVSAILVAGRSGSAITAEIGSMQMREELDAIRVIGANPIEILVLPRVIAMVLVLPAVTLLSGVTAMFGAMLVSMAYSNLSPTAFLVRLSEAVDLFTFVWGIWKAPAVGLFIALISCNDGMKVEGSAESLGRQVTLSVVKSIFLVFLLDSLFVLLFTALQG